MLIMSFCCILGADMSVASHGMYSAVRDAYELNWLGHSDVVSAMDVCRDHLFD